MSLILNSVSYSYYAGTPFEKKALSNISLTVAEGEFVGIAGPTGSGKSTLMRLIKGLVKPTSGSIQNSEKTGLVFQYPENQLFEETVIKDVMFGPLNLGKTRENAEKLSKEALNSVGIKEALFNRNPLTLSGGEKRKVAIAGVLSMDVDILLLDEPAAGLDNRGCERLFELLKILNQNGKTIVMVTHNMDHINRYCTKALVLENGSAVAYGKPSELDYCKTERTRIIDRLKELDLYP